MAEHPKLQNFVQESVNSIVWICILSLSTCVIALGMVFFDLIDGHKHYQKAGPISYRGNGIDLSEMIIWENIY